MPARNILLFSTLNPFPFWAGSENLWFDLLQWKGTTDFQFQVRLADSPMTRKKAEVLSANGVQVSFYQHLNSSFLRRNIYKLKDRILKSSNRSFPWYSEIKKGDYDLIFFNVATLADLSELSYAVDLCEQKGFPYWLLLQHGYEDFFLSDSTELEKTRRVAKGAKRFIFISKKNRQSLERAIGEELTNAFHSVNAIPISTINEGAELSQTNSISTMGAAKFFNLGRFSPKDKAQHLLLEAFSKNEWKERDWQLSFIGVDGFGQAYLEKLIFFYKLDPRRINIVQYTNIVLEEIVKHDVLLMPSAAEGTPFAMIESMACGRPALGTPIGGIPELINHGETGWLSRTVAVEDIRETLEHAWQDREKWGRMGQKAQQFIAEKYNQANSFPELLRALQDDIQ